MNEDFRFHLGWLGGLEGDPFEQSTFAEISLVAADETITALEDSLAHSVRQGVRGPAYDLALWFVENWWRLRWEPESHSVDWRLSHVLAAVGGGVAWPNVCFASDGLHVLVQARSTLLGKGAPVRYLHNGETYIRAASFEAGTFDFVQTVLARLSSLAVGESDLSSLWSQLLTDREEPSREANRRMEALLGFDLDEAPSELVSQLLSDTEAAGAGAVQEVAAAAKVHALDVLKDVIGRARSSSIRIKVQPPHYRLSQRDASSSDLPWQRAESAARTARQAWSIPQGPVSDAKLSDVLSVNPSVFEATAQSRFSLSAGLRSNHGTSEVSVAMKSRWNAGRRFEMMRIVADYLGSSDRLLPITSARTDRQKFQRAFAQEFLLPFDELKERFGLGQLEEHDIGIDDIEEVASEYRVSPLLVSTLLVNKGVLARSALPAAPD